MCAYSWKYNALVLPDNHRNLNSIFHALYQDTKLGVEESNNISLVPLSLLSFLV